MTAVPEPGNSRDNISELDPDIKAITLMVIGGKPMKLDLGGVSLFEAGQALRTCWRIVDDACMDFVECDELEVDDDYDDD